MLYTIPAQDRVGLLGCATIPILDCVGPSPANNCRLHANSEFAVVFMPMSYPCRPCASVVAFAFDFIPKTYPRKSAAAFASFLSSMPLY